MAIELNNQQPTQPPPSSPNAQNSPSTPTSSKRCPACHNSGLRGWKQPENYPLKECVFCECEYGILALDYWTKRQNAKQQKRIDQLFDGAGMPAHFRDFTLDTFEHRAKDKGKLSILARVREYLTNGFVVDQRTGRYKFSLILSGEYGTGKTGILTPILRDFLERGKVGLWIEAKEFVKEIQRGYKPGADEDSAETKMDAAKRADIILLDDLGDKARTEIVNGSTIIKAETSDRIEIIYRLINHRHNAALPMLITTNLSGPELGAQIGERTFNRIIESCAWLSMPGRNLRME